MAEAAVPTPRFFCHICKSETTPNLPDLVCPNCDSGFIEEVDQNSSLLQNHTSSQRREPASISPELWQMLFMERTALLSNPSSETELDNDEPSCAGSSSTLSSAGSSTLSSAGSSTLSSAGSSTLSSAGSSTLSSVSLRSDLLESREPQISNDQGPSSSSSSSLSDESAEEEILQQFFFGLFNINSDGAVTSSSRDRWRLLQLHSSPGDYAWGQRGLDTVITDLIERLDISGPPPAEKDSISSLPTVFISQEHKDSRLDCPVCMEAYSLGESVRQLPCLHYFHSDCIVPWLELHDTCPVCRKSLSGVDHCLLSSVSFSSDTSPEESEELEQQARTMCQ